MKPTNKMIRKRYDINTWEGYSQKKTRTEQSDILIVGSLELTLGETPELRPFPNISAEFARTVTQVASGSGFCAFLTGKN